jgi:membrane-associated phospholipid phosphatase
VPAALYDENVDEVCAACIGWFREGKYRVLRSSLSRLGVGTPRTLLTAPLAVLIATSLFLGALFLHLGDEVREGETLAADRSALHTIDANTASVPVAVANDASLPGAEVVVGAVGLALTAAFLLRRRVVDALFIAASIGGYAALTLVVKHVVQRQRPVAFFRVPESGYSFPSGHTFGATCLAAAVGYLLWRSRWHIGAKAALTAMLVAMVALVGASRLVLGVHYPTDVLGGLLLGGAWMAALVAARYAVERARWRTA